MSRSANEQLVLDTLRDEFEEALLVGDTETVRLVIREIRNRGAEPEARACERKLLESQNQVDWDEQ